MEQNNYHHKTGDFDSILIVDDNPNNLQVVGTILSQHNYKIAIANNGEKAIQIANKRNIDLILLDIMMPGMSGFDVIKVLKEQEATKDIPVIFLSAKNEVEDIVLGFSLGGVDYITKPFKKEEVLVRIQQQIYLKKARETILRQNEDLVKLNQVKNEFLNIAAHDLKNPVSGIRGLADVMLEQIDELDRDTILEFARIIKNTSNNMFQIIIDLLDINMIEEGKFAVNLTKFNFSDLLQTKVDFNQTYASKKNIQIHYRHPLDDIFVTCDRMILGQIFDNLISNAIKFSPFDKHIWVKTVKYLDEEKQIEYVRFSVKDEGPGIPANELPLLFSKFGKLTPRPTNDEASTGLGLSIVKKLIEILGGKVWCESEENVGTNFFVELPVVITMEEEQ